MRTFGLARIGRDVEVRTTPQGKQVASLSLAFTYFLKGERQTQWIEGALWDPREGLLPHLVKGGLIAVVLDDVHIETYEGKNGPGTKLVGRVSNVELAGGGGDRQEAPKPAPQRSAPAAPAPRQASSGFEDMDDDIPFANPMRSRAFCLSI